MVNKSSFYNPETAEFLDPAVTRKVAIVTGGNSGIGWFTVLHLYLHGYVVYVAGRTELKVLKAIEQIKEEANKRVSKYTQEEKQTRFLGSLTFIYFDCCDLSSVSHAASEILHKEKHLDILINNAGVMGIPFELTKDGYEIQYQVNFVAPLLFTLKLLPVLEATSSQTKSRVVFLSSIGHNAAYKYFEPTDTIKKFPDSVFTWVRYGNAKAAAIEVAQKLAKIYPNIEFFSVHPGMIVETELYNYWVNLPVIGRIAKAGTWAVGSVLGISLEEGSLGSLRAALDPTLDTNGIYLDQGGAVGRALGVATSTKNIERTWTENIRMLEEKGFLEDVKV